MYTRRLEHTEFFFGRALTAGNNRTRVTHAPARWCSNTGDVSHDWLGYIGLNELGGLLFFLSADLADQNYSPCLGIILKAANAVDEAHAMDGIAADTDACALTETGERRLVYGFVSQRAGTRHNPHHARLVNRARHNADLALTGRDNARAVRTNEYGARIVF